MTLDEAIKHCEEKAKELFCKADEDYYFDGNWNKRVDCQECAKEHEQLAGWLKDYKQLLEERPQGEWEYDKLFGDCAYVCSFCHTIWMSSEIQNMHYCPTCGADMRGKEE